MACGRELTIEGHWGQVSEWKAPEEDQQSPVAKGRLIRLAKDAVPVSRGQEVVAIHVYSPEGAISVHPEMAIRANLKSTGSDHGCCGSSGTDGPNRACICGNIVGTEWSDCWTQAEIRFLPDAVAPRD